MTLFDVILWDIDGTLLHGGGVGRESTQRALKDVFGTSNGLQTHRFGGKTDWFTLNELMGANGFSRDEIAARLPAFSKAISRHMAALISNYEVTALPMAVEWLQALDQQGRVLQGIVTGNVQANVPVKLKAAGFDPTWFKFGAYGDESADRNALPPLALERAATLAGSTISPERVLVVGDTIRDVEAARSVGAKVAIVGTGYSADPVKLAAANPDWLLTDLTVFDTVMPFPGG